MSPEDQAKRFVGRLQPVGRLIKTVLKDLDRIAFQIFSRSHDADIVAVILLVKTRDQIHGPALSVSFISYVEGLSIIHRGDQAHFPVDVDRLSVDLSDHVAGLKPCFHCRRIRYDLPDDRQVRPGKSHQDKGEHETQDEICHGTGQHRSDPAAHGRVREGVLIELPGSFSLFRDHLFHSVKNTGPSDRKKADAQIRFFSLLPEQDRPHSNIKFKDTDAAAAGDGKMSEFMGDHDHTENDQKNKYTYNHIYSFGSSLNLSDTAPFKSFV